jgi:all-trans-retinol dehydrogenase (NAD+)
MTQIRGRKVLVTGGASGMGRRIALECALRHARQIVIWDLDAARLSAVAQEVRDRGCEVRTDVVSVADRRQVYETARDVQDRGGPVDVLVNSAGVVSGKPFLEIPDEQIERSFAVNTMALYWVCKAFVPKMVERNSGHVVTLASASALMGVAKLADYAASKWAAMGFDESLRFELAKLAPSVRTTVVCPYYVNTGMFAGARSRFPRLLPILDEEVVVRRIMRAIERGHRRLFLPWSMYLLPMLRVLPVPAFDAVAGFLGVNASMDEFVGRPGAEVTARDNRSAG